MIKINVPFSFSTIILHNYSKHSETERKEIYQPLLDLLSPAFIKEADAWIELNHMYDVVFPKLLRVIRGTIPDNDEIEESVYREIMLVEERKCYGIKLWKNKR